MSRFLNSELANSINHNANAHTVDEGEIASEEKEQRMLINQAITRYLAQREHGFNELIQKLVRKGFTSKWVEQVVQEFSDRDWQSDERYAQVMIKHRIDKGYGQRFIQSECQTKGLCSDLVSRVLDEFNTDWYDIAYRCAERKFGLSIAADQKAKMKRYRFLTQRGFSGDIIRAVLDDLNAAPDDEL